MKHFATVECPLCHTACDGIPVDYSGGIGHAALAVAPCAACGSLLCASCPQFHCDVCGEHFCAEHAVEVPASSPQYKPWKCCAACAAGIAAEEEPEESAPEYARFMQPVRCGTCGVLTGYAFEAGKRVTCSACAWAEVFGTARKPVQPERRIAAAVAERRA